VLKSLARPVSRKHLALRRDAGEFDFFHQQAEEYRKAWQNNEVQLAAFTRDEGVVSPALEKEIAVRKQAESEATSRETKTAIGDPPAHSPLEKQLASLPSRLTTQVRTSDNPQLMERLKSTLLDLELKRTDLLTKFDPSYRLFRRSRHRLPKRREAIDAGAESANFGTRQRISTHL